MIYQHGKSGYLFISRSQIKVKERDIRKSIDLVVEKFFENYGDILGNWDGNTKYFKNFGEVIEDIFKDAPTDRAKKALW